MYPPYYCMYTNISGPKVWEGIQYKDCMDHGEERERKEKGKERKPVAGGWSCCKIGINSAAWGFREYAYGGSLTSRYPPGWDHDNLVTYHTSHIYPTPSIPYHTYLYFQFLCLASVLQCNELPDSTGPFTGCVRFSWHWHWHWHGKTYLISILSQPLQHNININPNNQSMEPQYAK